MADADVSNGARSSTDGEASVLAKLPRTRPQRSSARRVAARGAANGAGARAGGRRPAKAPSHKPQTSPAKSARPAKTRDSAASAQAKAAAAAPRPAGSSRTQARTTTRRQPTPPRRPLPLEDDPAPRQGYECEGADGPVQPPGGPELVASAAEIVGELAKAGLSAGERLLKDVFARLPGS